MRNVLLYSFSLGYFIIFYYFGLFWFILVYLVIWLFGSFKVKYFGGGNQLNADKIIKACLSGVRLIGVK